MNQLYERSSQSQTTLLLFFFRINLSESRFIIHAITLLLTDSFSLL